MKLNLQKTSDELQSKIYTCTYIGGKGWEKPWNKASGHIMDIKCSSPQIMLAGKSMHLIESIGKVRWWVWLCNTEPWCMDCTTCDALGLSCLRQTWLIDCSWSLRCTCVCIHLSPLTLLSLPSSSRWSVSLLERPSSPPPAYTRSFYIL